MNKFNVTAFQDQFLDVMMKYCCRILFTTRSRYENHISSEVGELDPDTPLELSARLLANSLLKPKALLPRGTTKMPTRPETGPWWTLKYVKKQGKPYINLHEQREKAEYKN